MAQDPGNDDPRSLLPTILPALEGEFPRFARFLMSGDADPIDEILPPYTLSEIEQLEREELEQSLPPSYRAFLQIAGGMCLQGGAVRIHGRQLFFLYFPPLESMKWEQRRQAGRQNGGVWPPPSEGMLCFADFWSEGDGDQALFDVSGGLVDGEYPVFYYNHDQGSTRRIADGFRDWLERVVPGNSRPA